MSFADSPSLEIERQARSERAVAVGAMAVALGDPWLLPLPPNQSALVAIIAGAVVGLCCWWAGLIGEQRRVALAIWDRDGHWWLVDAKGDRSTARLDIGSTIWPVLIWLHWSSDRGARHMLLWRWGMPAVSWRRLAARLRLQGVNAAELDETEQKAAAGRVS